MATLKTIVIANRKGGVGKTTTAYNLAHYIAKQNKNVCLLDLDSQGNLSHTCNSGFISIEAFMNADIKNVNENVDIVSACNDFAMLEKMMLEKINYFSYLKNNLIPKIISQGYEYLLIDTSPAVNPINTNAFIMSDMLLIAIALDDYSIFGLSNMLEIVAQVKEINTSIKSRIFVNGFVKNRVYNKVAIENLEKLDMFSNIYIPLKQSIKDNIARHVPSYDIKEYQNLCMEVL